jgi:ribonuclease BN (tRNA processing enzyme)
MIWISFVLMVCNGSYGKKIFSQSHQGNDRNYCPMQIRVLGCSGGIGRGLRTTSFLIGDSILVDAGSGLGDLTREEMRKIRHIFVSHSHLDHIHSLPLLVDTVFDSITTPLTIHALPQTIKALKQHIFNEIIWPDFSKLPSVESPVIRYKPIKAGESVVIGDLTIEAVKVNHIVPTVGYVISEDGRVFAFSGDTTTNDTWWEALNRYPNVDILVVEVAFSNKERALCDISRHYCPDTLAQDLTKLNHYPHIYLSHAKPGEIDLIFDEVSELVVGHHLHHLRGGEGFTL